MMVDGEDLALSKLSKFLGKELGDITNKFIYFFNKRIAKIAKTRKNTAYAVFFLYQSLMNSMY